MAIYRETIYWKMIFALILVIDVPLLLLFLYEMSLPPVPDAVEVGVLFIIITAMALVLLTFGRLTITMTATGISAGFGHSKKSFGWGEVEDCYPDDASALEYGGFGIKYGIHHGRKRLVYNITSARRVVVRVRGKKYDEFVFSTKNPDQCMRVIRMQIGPGAARPS